MINTPAGPPGRAATGVDHVRAAFDEHVAAFNAHDSQRVLAGFAPDAEWITGVDRFAGAAALADVFDPWLWTLDPRLDVLRVVTDDATAAAELRETLTVDGAVRSFDIAAFLVIRDGLIVRGKVYREGRADL